MSDLYHSHCYQFVIKYVVLWLAYVRGVCLDIYMNNYCEECNTFLGEDAEGTCDPCYAAWESANGLHDLDWIDEEMMQEYGVA